MLKQILENQRQLVVFLCVKTNAVKYFQKYYSYKHQEGQHPYPEWAERLEKWLAKTAQSMHK